MNKQIYFNECSHLTSIPPNLFDDVTSFTNVFFNCHNLVGIPPNLYYITRQSLINKRKNSLQWLKLH